MGTEDDEEPVGRGKNDEPARCWRKLRGLASWRKLQDRKRRETEKNRDRGSEGGSECYGKRRGTLEEARRKGRSCGKGSEDIRENTRARGLRVKREDGEERVTIR